MNVSVRPPEGRMVPEPHSEPKEKKPSYAQSFLDTVDCIEKTKRHEPCVEEKQR